MKSLRKALVDDSRISAQHLLGGHAFASAVGVLQPAHEVLADHLDQFALLVLMADSATPLKVFREDDVRVPSSFLVDPARARFAVCSAEVARRCSGSWRRR